MTQMMAMIKDVCSTVSILKAEFEAFKSSHQSSPPPPSVLPAAPISQLAIRDEIRELHEREKRKDSIVIRGIKATNDNIAAFSSSFNAVVEHLLPGRSINLNEVVVIEEELVRAKVTDSLKRRDLLSKATTLRSSFCFSEVYISRDLTYKQRGERKAKRDALAAQILAEHGRTGNRLPVHPAPRPDHPARDVA